MRYGMLQKKVQDDDIVEHCSECIEEVNIGGCK